MASDLSVVRPLVPYVNLQWNRRYYDFGQFEIQMPIDCYEDGWSFVACRELARPEVGVVQKVAYSNGGGERLVSISGFFAEKMLDGVICAPRFVADKKTTGATVKALCERYRVDEKKGIRFFSGEELGGRTQSDFLGDKLGTKLYSILETRELSYSVGLTEFVAHEPLALGLRVWQGVDRTAGQSENPRAFFSTDWGNLTSESYTRDTSAYANVCIVSAEDEALQFEVDLSGGGERFETFLDKGSSKPSDGQSEEDFKAALEQEALEKLAACVISIDADANVLDGYLDTYDLGDIASFAFEDIGLMFDARIVEVSEVFKPEGHTISLSFGTKRISNLERALRS